MKITLKSGRKLELKDLTVDERDELLDNVQYDLSGGEVKVKMMHSTMTKFIRIGLNMKVTDDFLKKLSFEEKTELFTAIQKDCMNLGEDEPSK